MSLNRRNFIKQSTLAGSALIASPFNRVNKKIHMENMTFQLKIFATNWGFSGSLTEFCKKAKDEGYDGVEVWVPSDEKDREAFFNAVAKYDLAYGFLAGNSGKTFEAHLADFQFQMERAASYKPIYINCHAGKDFFPYDQNRQFIDFSTQIANKSGIPVYHETHRGRILFAAHLAKDFLQRIPELRLTLDISHWCCVAESLLENQGEAVNLALSRTDHVHSRVGFEEGPQVSEPRAPEFKKAVDAHFAWWDKIVEQKKQSGATLTMTTEFGPANYMWTLPYTRQPLANLWEVNAYMMRLWRERYL